MELIHQGEQGFNQKDYTKSKLISYGIGIATMGIGAIASSTKILAKAASACRNLADKLRKVGGAFGEVCKAAANQLDKVAQYIDKAISKIEFARKTMGQQAEHLAKLKDSGKLEEFQHLQKLVKTTDALASNSQKMMQIIKSAVVSSVKGAVVSVAMEKIFTATLSKIMEGLKPHIAKEVKNVVDSKFEKNDALLNQISKEDVQLKAALLFETSLGEDVEYVLKEIGSGVLRHCKNWKAQLATLAIETIVSTAQLSGCTGKICDKFFDELSSVQKTTSSTIKESQKAEIKNTITENITNIIYSQIVAMTGKIVTTLTTALYLGYKQNQEKKTDKSEVAQSEYRASQIEAANNNAEAKNSGCAHNAVGKTLGVDSKQLSDATSITPSTLGASSTDIKNMYGKVGITTTEYAHNDATISKFQAHESDRAVACLTESKSGIGHAVPCFLKDDELKVREGGKTVSLRTYIEQNRYDSDKAKVLIPHKVNTTTMLDLTQQIHRKRIANATSPLQYVGQGDGQKFKGDLVVNIKADGSLEASGRPANWQPEAKRLKGVGQTGDRRHVVSWEELRGHFKDLYNSLDPSQRQKFVDDILTKYKKNIAGKTMQEKVATALNCINSNARNLVIGDAKFNQSLPHIPTDVANGQAPAGRPYETTMNAVLKRPRTESLAGDILQTPHADVMHDGTDVSRQRQNLALVNSMHQSKTFLNGAPGMGSDGAKRAAIQHAVNEFMTVIDPNPQTNNNLRYSERKSLQGIIHNVDGLYHYIADTLGSSRQLSILDKMRARTSRDSDEAISTNKIVRLRNPITLIPEDDHLTEHQTNVTNLIERIKSGEIKAGTVIYLERKAEGNNLGMRDVILIANILKHNESSQAKLAIPAYIMNSPIYYDAMLYNAAKEHNVLVQGVEGKKLAHGKWSEQYNNTREDYIADKLKQASEYGDVICLIGSSHIDGITRRLNGTIINTQSSDGNNIGKYNERKHPIVGDKSFPARTWAETVAHSESIQKGR